jgi:hypothetical protein
MQLLYLLLLRQMARVSFWGMIHYTKLGPIFNIIMNVAGFFSQNVLLLQLHHGVLLNNPVDYGIFKQ